jgi:CelD/BcsL family acetyltransferase involved in cellulose biosynthesis
MRYPDQGNVQLIQSDEEFDSLETEWEGLYQTSGLGNPFLSYAWAKAWRSSSLCPESRLFILTYRRSGKLAGILPLRLENRFGIRVLRFLVDGRADYLSALHHPSDLESAQMLYGALAQRQKVWDLAIFRNWNDAILDLDPTLLPPTLLHDSEAAIPAPYLDLPEDWAELIRTGPTMLRQSKRKASRFARDGGTIELVCDIEPQMVNTITHYFSAIESQSWKFGTSAARFQSEADKRMLGMLLTPTALPNTIEVWLAFLHDNPIAFMLNFKMADRTCYYQGAFDKRMSKLSPGAVLHYHAIKRTWEMGLREYDFMMGDESWKLGWTNRERLLQQHVIYQPNARSSLLFRAFGLAKAARRKLKRSAVASNRRRNTNG